MSRRRCWPVPPAVARLDGRRCDTHVMRRSLAAAIVAAGLLAMTGTANALSTVTEYSVLPSSPLPCTVARDAQTRDVYFSPMLGVTRSSVGSIGVLNPTTRAVTNIPLPDRLATPGGMAFGANGAARATSSRRLGAGSVDDRRIAL